MKFMNLKRFASITMAGAMALSLAVPAMAEDTSTVITASYTDTELDVEVPANTSATINPYGLPVTLGDATTVLSGQPITIATPLMVKNQSGVALKMGANVKAEVTTGVTLETAANKGGVAAGTAKALYVEFQAFAADGIDGATALDPTATCPAWAALEDDDAALTAVLATGATGVDATAVGDDLVLREGADGQAQAGGVAFVRLSGIAAKKPTTAWAEADTLTATITYSFEPSTYSKSAGTFGADPTLSAATGTPRDLALTLPDGVTPNDAGLTWKSSDDTKATVADSSASGAYKCTITPVAAGTFTVTVSFVGTDGITYTATSNTLTVS